MACSKTLFVTMILSLVGFSVQSVAAQAPPTTSTQTNQQQTIAPQSQQSPNQLPPPQSPVSLPSGVRLPDKSSSRQSTVSRYGRGSQQLAAGDYASAVQTYHEGRQAAKASGNSGAAADAAFQEARAIESLVSADPAQQVRITEAIGAYDDAIELGDSAQKWQAQNNKGALLIREGKVQDAVTVFRQIDPMAIDPGKKFIYEYNLGRALELNGNFEGSYEKYVMAVKGNADFEPAISGAFRVLYRMHPAPIQNAADLGNLLLAREKQNSAILHIRESLNIWPKEAEAQRLLAVWLRHAALRSVTPPEFEQSEWSALASLLEHSPQLREPIQEVKLAYLGTLPMVLEDSAAIGLFPAWAGKPWRTEPMSLCLKSVGDYYVRSGSHQRALAHYSAAWMLDRSNAEAALAAAVLLRDHADLLPSNERLIESLIPVIFEAKGRAYTQNDWPNILRLHMVLATIFEYQRRWGPPREARSVVFQLEHALTALARVREMNSDFPPAPGIHMRLAHAYARIQNFPLAWDQYSAAAEEFIRDSKLREASDAVKRADSLSVSLNVQQQERMRRIKNSLGSSPT
jgi:tetratricopeptide (TPR) repeat protein